MADGVFNVAKGRANELVNRVANADPSGSGLVIVLLESAVADGTMMDYPDLSALLGATGNTEAAFTNYARKELTDTVIFGSASLNSSDEHTSDFPDQTWTSAGGTTDETLAKLIVCYAPNASTSTDNNIIPLTYHDFVVTTNGTDLTAQVDANGFFKAA